MSWAKVADHVVIDCPEYLWELEEHRDGDRQMMFIHLTVRKWRKGLLRHMVETFRSFRKVVTCPLFAKNPDEDDKWVKFITYFGFKPLQEVVCENGERRQLFVHFAPTEKEEHGQQVRANQDREHAD